MCPHRQHNIAFTIAGLIRHVKHCNSACILIHVDCQKSTLANRNREEESDIAGEEEGVGDDVSNSALYGTQRFLRYQLFANLLFPPRPLQPVLVQHQLFVVLFAAFKAWTFLKCSRFFFSVLFCFSCLLQWVIAVVLQQDITHHVQLRRGGE